MVAEYCIHRYEADGRRGTDCAAGATPARGGVVMVEGIDFFAARFFGKTRSSEESMGRTRVEEWTR